jgi:hypothetical protein
MFSGSGGVNRLLDQNAANGNKQGSALTVDREEELKVDVVLPPVQVRVVEEKDIPKADSKVTKSKNIQSPNTNCKSYYGGIGVSTRGGEIEVVYPNYPAEAAGVQVGYVIVKPHSSAVRGKINETFILTVFRKGVYLDFALTRAKVCYENVQN